MRCGAGGTTIDAGEFCASVLRDLNHRETVGDVEPDAGFDVLGSNPKRVISRFKSINPHVIAVVDRRSVDASRHTPQTCALSVEHVVFRQGHGEDLRLNATEMRQWLAVEFGTQSRRSIDESGRERPQVIATAVHRDA